MKTALRIAVEGFLLLPDQQLTVQQVHEAAPVSLRAVRGYLHRLHGERILRPMAAMADAYTTGPGFARWLRTEPKTLTGGNSRAYLTAKAQRDSLARAEAALIRAAQVRRRMYGGDE